MRQTRAPDRGAYAFVDEFVEAVQEVFPKCCIHFEDWTGVDAVHLLQRYRDKYCVYNDDVQGTAGITLAGMINATRLKGTKLQDEKYLFLGAGSAAIGLADLLCTALVEQGMTLEDARARVHMFDINGLLEPSRTDLVDFQRPYAHPHSPTKDFVEAIKSIRPTTIIGVSTIGGAFTQQVVEAMSEINERPVILALSNPDRTCRMHSRAGLLMVEGKGDLCRRGPVPAGSSGRSDLPARPGQQLLHFPGDRDGRLRDTGVKRVTDEMFIEAASAVADQVPSELLKHGLLYPLQPDILETEIQTAARVAKLVFDSGTRSRGPAHRHGRVYPSPCLQAGLSHSGVVKSGLMERKHHCLSARGFLALRCRLRGALFGLEYGVEFGVNMTGRTAAPADIIEK